MSLNSQPTCYNILPATEPTKSGLQNQNISHPGKLFHNHSLPLRVFIHKIYK